MEVINVGAAELSGDGDSLRQAFVKVNANFQEIINMLSASTRVSQPPASSTGSTGDRAGDIASDNAYLYYCKAAYNGSTPIWERVLWDTTPW